MTFLRIFKHLLPNARAWRITADKKLRQFFEGLAPLGSDVKSYLDLVWLDIFPETTREVSKWEAQFGLPDTGITDQERRARLAATWKAQGGQDPRYIQETLQQNGFDVYVHEWWEPGSEPEVGEKACAIPRNPQQWLRREAFGIFVQVDCGEALALCGEAFAEAGNGVEPPGYPLVNKIIQTVPDVFNLCGEQPVECGAAAALCGNYLEFKDVVKEYIVPSDASKWPYFLYIGGETFGELAQVDPKRRDEFEALCLKICPAQQWLGILVEYI